MPALNKKRKRGPRRGTPGSKPPKRQVRVITDLPRAFRGLRVWR